MLTVGKGFQDVDVAPAGNKCKHEHESISSFSEKMRIVEKKGREKRERKKKIDLPHSAVLHPLGVC